ncbi:alkanesulfonate monooxygenase SsuD/methylene tetrahydromethanopterin reductase-like flavin-dependent oxidoreductase (luciferase family) [Kitasatospora sp. MAA4]|uniref:LLM class flavin-dependent oxidoreductase n=1 Tax=Kitasatospora sp. MAA4 TaxID=3035093 RepID=UPI002474B104|nr:LLM class flavin-dependent oxidoreductase [Kitasatospora sp. MAA4]MDH6130922.1 alkanesulfonate monooxygenase SsuD/methylene tetrahydromethanopterin reductase-like flavin-dependent oxidoreductase (luciferase family) [Kitasatospora sp. MAA4]
MSTTGKAMHLAALFPSNQSAGWRDPRSGDHSDFATFTGLARTAERGLFDFFLLADYPRLTEHRGAVSEVGTAGELDQITVLSALSTVTERIGLVPTVNATFNEPFDVARRLASLDHFSNGRSGWNVVTTSNAWTGENFRRGGYLPHADRYQRAAEFVCAARTMWRSRAADGPGLFQHDGPQFRISGHFTVPAGPQGCPPTIQAGDSEQGREFAASHADVVYSRHRGRAGHAFAADIRSRTARQGRGADQVKIMPGVSFALGDTDEEARDNARAAQELAISPQLAICYLERTWGRDLSSHDPDGPLPDTDPERAPDPSEWPGIAAAEARSARAQKWRSYAAQHGLGIRQLVMKLTGGKPFVGTPARVAQQMTDYVRSGGADGFVLVPGYAPGGLDEFVDRVVPELQERGSYRTAYTGETLRDHLGQSTQS